MATPISVRTRHAARTLHYRHRASMDETRTRG
jgi:hypothetical protein